MTPEPTNTVASTPEDPASTQGSDVEAMVRALLDRAGLHPDPAELEVLVGVYPGLQEGIETLYAIPEVRYGAPGLVFDANPNYVDWAS